MSAMRLRVAREGIKQSNFNHINIWTRTLIRQCADLNLEGLGTTIDTLVKLKQGIIKLICNINRLERSSYIGGIKNNLGIILP